MSRSKAKVFARTAYSLDANFLGSSWKSWPTFSRNLVASDSTLAATDILPTETPRNSLLLQKKERKKKQISPTLAASLPTKKEKNQEKLYKSGNSIHFKPYLSSHWGTTTQKITNNNSSNNNPWPNSSPKKTQQQQPTSQLPPLLPCLFISLLPSLPSPFKRD